MSTAVEPRHALATNFSLCPKNYESSPPYHHLNPRTTILGTFWEGVLFEGGDDGRGHDHEGCRADEPEVERVDVLDQLYDHVAGGKGEAAKHDDRDAEHRTEKRDCPRYDCGRFSGKGCTTMGETLSNH